MHLHGGGKGRSALPGGRSRDFSGLRQNQYTPSEGVDWRKAVEPVSVVHRVHLAADRTHKVIPSVSGQLAHEMP